MLNGGAVCSSCGATFHRDGEPFTVCKKCGGALLLQYRLAHTAETVSKAVLKKRTDTFWKFTELLPLESSENIVSLGEPYTPVLRLSTGFDTAYRNVFLKDDGRLPTGTFKARGMAVAVSKLKELNIKRVAVPSAGNAAAALAAYGAKTGLEVFAFIPKEVPESILKECVYLGAKVYLVDGSIGDAGKIIRRLREYDWFDMSTNRQPYRFEGYKAAAFEIAEQFNWNLPDSILFPTGGGEGVIGLWKGFRELVELGWTKKTPRLIVVQSDGCAPLVQAYDRNQVKVDVEWNNPETIAVGLKVPLPYASYLVLRAVRETKGLAVAVRDSEIISSMETFFEMGIYACPEAASTLAAVNKLQSQGIFDFDENVLLYLTGNAQKYFDVLPIEKEKIPLLSEFADSLPDR